MTATGSEEYLSQPSISGYSDLTLVFRYIIERTSTPRYSVLEYLLNPGFPVIPVVHGILLYKNTVTLQVALTPHTTDHSAIGLDN